MEQKTISIAQAHMSFSLKCSGSTYLPMYAVPTYSLTPNVIKYYSIQELNFIKDIDPQSVEPNTRKDPIQQLLSGESLLSVFLPEPDHASLITPYGFSWLEVRNYQGQKIIYISEIENFAKKEIKGVGKATTAQAIGHHLSLFPGTPDEAIALRIIPRHQNKKLIERYEGYGFSTQKDGYMCMSLARAKEFWDTYYARMERSVHKIRRSGEGRRP